MSSSQVQLNSTYIDSEHTFEHALFPLFHPNFIASGLIKGVNLLLK